MVDSSSSPSGSKSKSTVSTSASSSIIPTIPVYRHQTGCINSAAAVDVDIYRDTWIRYFGYANEVRILEGRVLHA